MSNDYKFLCTLFPEQQNEIKDLLGIHSVDQIIEILLKEEDGIWSSLIMLKEMFPSKDEEYLYNLVLENDFEVCLDIIQREGKQEQLRLPKTRIQKFNVTEKDLKFVQECFPNIHSDSVYDYIAAYGTEGAVTRLSSVDCDPRERLNKSVQELKEILPTVPESRLIWLWNEHGTVEAVLDYIYNDNKWETKLDIQSQSKPLIHFYIPKQEINTKDTPMKISSNDPYYLRQRAYDLRQKRNQLYQEAAEYYKRGQLTGKSSASYYADQANSLNKEIESLNNQAAHLIFRDNKREKDVLDFHGLTLQESIKELGEYLCNRRRLKIITGAGIHSQGRSVLMPGLKRFVKQKGWTVEDGASKFEMDIDSEMLNLFTIATLALVSSAPMQVCPNGVCPKIVGLGKHCGGNMKTAAKCGTGLVCQLGKMADVGGSCVPMADLNGAPLGGSCNNTLCTDTLLCDSATLTCIQKINF
ncbi:hypothetical protein HDV06_005489 [Boothiomyces sp. JEL0866]|nr:hypothetical protein HDV06_005489 [Boothiomyces sp. JEL0866]